MTPTAPDDPTAVEQKDARRTHDGRPSGPHDEAEFAGATPEARAAGTTSEAPPSGPPAGGAPGSATGDDGRPAGDGPEEEEPFEKSGVGKHTLIYGAGILLSKALAFVMLPVYTHYLTPADYGVMGLIEMTLDVVAIVAGPQLAPAIFRFYHKAETPDERHDVVGTALMLLGVSYTIVGITTFLGADLISHLVFDTGEHAGLIRLASGNLIFQCLMIVPLAYARVKDRSKLFVTANAGKLFLSAGLNVLFLVGMGMGVAGIFLSTLITRIIVGSILTAWVIRSVGLRFSTEKMKVLLRYGIPLVGTQFATFAATFGDRYFLEHAAGESVVGLYNLAYQFGFLLAVVGFVPFHQVWGPKRFHVAQRSDGQELLAKGFVYSNVVLLTVATGISVLVGDVLSIMTAPSFHGAATLVPIILIAYVFQSWAGIQDIGILVKERTEFVTLANWVAAGLALVLYWILVPRYYGLGAAVATVIAFAVRYALTFGFSQWLWHVDYRWSPVLRLAAITVAVSGAGLLLDIEPVWLSLPVRFVLLGLYALAVWNAGILTDDERRAVLDRSREVLGRVWRRVRRYRPLRAGASVPVPGSE